jgi:hypothetical protein
LDQSEKSLLEFQVTTAQPAKQLISAQQMELNLRGIQLPGAFKQILLFSKN